MRVSVLRRHEGVLFAAVGRIKLTYSGGQRELLAQLCAALGGKLTKLSKATRYLVVGEGAKTHAAEELNAQGANIEFVRQSALSNLFALNRGELLELVRGGEVGTTALRSILRALKFRHEMPNLEGVDLRGADLSELDLFGGNLKEADLRDAELSGARLIGTHENHLSWERVRLDGAKLRGTEIEYARFDGASFRGADLSGAALGQTSLEEADLSGANLDAVRLNGCNLSRACFVGASLRGATLRWGTLSGANLANVDLSDTELSVNLENVNLCGATVSLQGLVNLRGADLRRTRFVRSRLEGADLRDARLEGTDFGDTSMICARLGPPKGTGRAGPNFVRLRELWSQGTASTTIRVKVGPRHSAELRVTSGRYADEDETMWGHWSLIGPDSVTEGRFLQAEDLGRWFGGEGTVDLASISFNVEWGDRQRLHRAELEQLLRDVWSELLGIESLDSTQVEALRCAQRKELDRSGEPNILQQLAADLDNDELWLVYADWLQDQGDPRGEIIAHEMQLMKHADVHEKRLASSRLAAPHLQLVLGDLAHVEGCSFEFRRSHVHTIHLFPGRQAPKLCRTLASHPATRFARRLVSRTAASGVVQPLLALVGARPIDDLTLHSTGLSDVTPIGEHTKLRALDLGYTRVTDITPLAPLIHLEDLCLIHTQVEHLDLLSGMNELHVLNLMETRVKTLAAIAGKPIEKLYLSGWHLTDVDALLTLDSLKLLRVPQRPLPPKLRAALLEKLPDLVVEGEALRAPRPVARSAVRGQASWCFEGRGTSSGEGEAVQRAACRDERAAQRGDPECECGADEHFLATICVLPEHEA